MSFTDYRLIVSDLDGTLTPYCTDRISERTVRTVAALRKNGVEFTVATGRSWEQCKPVVTQLGITCPVIVQAGALVIDPGSERAIRTRPLSPELEIRLRQLEYNRDLLDQFCLAEGGHYYATRISTGAGEWLCRYGEKCHLVKEWRHQPTEIIKHLFIGPELSLRQLGLVIKTQVSSDLRMIFWPPNPDQQNDDWFLEVFDPLASKGQALQWLAGQLKLGMETVIAFGDGGNDLDMLQLAGMGVAIEDGSPEVAAATIHRAKRPEEDGVARFLSLLFTGMDPGDQADDGVA